VRGVASCLSVARNDRYGGDDSCESAGVSRWSVGNLSSIPPGCFGLEEAFGWYVHQLVSQFTRAEILDWWRAYGMRLCAGTSYLSAAGEDGGDAGGRGDGFLIGAIREDHLGGVKSGERST
jgi:hypothetical protein